MAFENQTGLGVFNQYGPRETGGTIGVEHSQDSIHQLSMTFTGSSIATGEFVSPVVLPEGAKILDYILSVKEAFALSGTSPTVLFGSKGSVATNGVVLTKAELEAVGTKAPASAGAGTWAKTSATGLAAAAEVAFDLGGTSPVVSETAGKATLVVRYIYK